MIIEIIPRLVPTPAIASITNISLDYIRGFSVEAVLVQQITRGARALVDAAKQEIQEYSVDETLGLKDRPDVVLVDIRDPRELKRGGRIEGAFHCPRGMLEFWIDPESPYHKEVFAEDKQFIFFCAGGLRSALATKTAQDMGLKPVAHMLGGFAAWKKAGAPIQEVSG